MGTWIAGKAKRQTSFGPIPLKKSVLYQKQHNNNSDFFEQIYLMEKTWYEQRGSHSMGENLHVWKNWSPCIIMCMTINVKITIKKYISSSFQWDIIVYCKPKNHGKSLQYHPILFIWTGEGKKQIPVQQLKAQKKKNKGKGGKQQKPYHNLTVFVLKTNHPQWVMIKYGVTISDENAGFLSCGGKTLAD